MGYKFELMERDWYKRRKPNDGAPSIVDFEVIAFEKTHNHLCEIKARFNDGQEKILISRVIYNQLTRSWTVDGMELAVKLIEKSED